MPYQDKVNSLAKENDNFRKVIYTGKHAQLVLMSLKAGEDIGEETHDTIDQFFYIVEGNGEAVQSGEAKPFEAGDVVFVDAGTLHNIKNTGSGDLKLFTLYSPPNHPDGRINRTKEEAEAAEKE